MCCCCRILAKGDDIYVTRLYKCDRIASAETVFWYGQTAGLVLLVAEPEVLLVLHYLLEAACLSCLQGIQSFLFIFVYH